MSGRIVDLDRTVYALCAADPGIAGILAEAGFRDVTLPGMLNTAGRFMTIPKGAAMKRIPLDRTAIQSSEEGTYEQGDQQQGVPAKGARGHDRPAAQRQERGRGEGAIRGRV
ncbi:MAG TPA: DUF1858 domain-containing protein [Clostridia bacterium]|nr:DUF1858 domain-containing protein [Clostridia bacterium]